MKLLATLGILLALCLQSSGQDNIDELVSSVECAVYQFRNVDLGTIIGHVYYEVNGPRFAYIVNNPTDFQDPGYRPINYYFGFDGVDYWIAWFHSENAKDSGSPKIADRLFRTRSLEGFSPDHSPHIQSYFALPSQKDWSATDLLARFCHFENIRSSLALKSTPLFKNDLRSAIDRTESWTITASRQDVKRHIRSLQLQGENPVGIGRYRVNDDLTWKYVIQFAEHDPNLVREISIEAESGITYVSGGDRPPPWPFSWRATLRYVESDRINPAVFMPQIYVSESTEIVDIR